MQVKVGGAWLSALGRWGDLSWSTVTRGSEELSWSMPDLHQPRLQGRKRVILYDGPLPVWQGILVEPDEGQGRYVARGLWEAGDRYLALNASDVPTGNPTTAVDEAISRGLAWSRSQALGASAIASDLNDETPTVRELLDQTVNRITGGVRWMVDPFGELVTYTPAVAWHIASGYTLGTSDEDFATTLYVIYKTSGGRAVTKVSNSAAADRFGYREMWADIRKMGNLTATHAEGVAQGLLDKQLGRLSFTHTLNLPLAHLLTAGGVPARPSQVRAGQRMVLHGGWDETQELAGRTTVSVVIGRTQVSPGSDAIQVEPVQRKARDLAGLLSRLPTKKDKKDAKDDD